MSTTNLLTGEKSGPGRSESLWLGADQCGMEDEGVVARVCDEEDDDNMMIEISCKKCYAISGKLKINVITTYYSIKNCDG